MPVESESADYREPVLLPSEADAGAALSELEPEAAPEVRCARVSAGQHGQRLDKILVALAPEFSRTHLQGLVERGHVQIEGQPSVTPSRRLHVGQQVQVELVPTEESQAFKPQAMVLDVLYEDPHLLVLNKPAGLVVHPAPGNWQGTLLNGLLARDPHAASLPRAGIVHRLDKDTSGVMMVGRTLESVTALVRAIAARQVHRRYLALAHGVSEHSDFEVTSPIGRDPQVRVRMAVVAGGRESRTTVHCVASQAGVTALQCTLHTGRTHQIRVHLSHVGHPLVADTLYGGRPALGLQRQALHATELQLAHPITGTPLDFVCQPPEDFAAAWQQVVLG